MLAKTMALKITEKSYPVAVACLTAGFMLVPPKEVLGCYLVINAVHVPQDQQEGSDKTLTIGNMWMSKEDFLEHYEFVEQELKTNFTEVRHL